MSKSPKWKRAPLMAVRMPIDEPLASADGTERVVVNYRIDPSGKLLLVTSEDGEVRERSVREVVDAVTAHRRLTDPEMEPNPYSEYLNWISADKARAALKLEPHIIDVIDGRPSEDDSPEATGPYDAAWTDKRDRRKSKMAELDVKPYQMSRWITGYKTYGAFGLVPRPGPTLRAAGVDKTPPTILPVLRDFAASRPLSSKKNLTTEHALVIADLRARGLVSATRGTVGLDGQPIPYEQDALPYGRFVKLMRQLSRGQDPRTAKTRQQQSKRPRVDSVRHSGFDFADYVEIDSTRTDFFVQTPNGPTRLWAVFAVCVSTRYMWVRLVMGSPRGGDLARLMFDMLGGEQALIGATGRGGEALPAIPRTVEVNAWDTRNGAPPAALPGCIVLDHGAEEENAYFIRFCAQLDIQIRWARTRRPTDKPYVESHIRLFSEWCQTLLGHSGNTVENQPDSTPKHLLTFEAARSLCASWMAWRATKPVTGLTHPHAPGQYLTPLQAVRLSLTRGNPVWVLADPTWPLSLLPHLSLTPWDDGVTWRRRRFTCPGYEDLIAAALEGRSERRKLTFYYDPDAPDRLYWPVPGTFEVRVLHPPGPASGVTGAFDEVRRHLAMTEPGQRWPDHNDITSHLADWIEANTPTDSDVAPPPGRPTGGKPGPQAGDPSWPAGGWTRSGIEDILAGFDATAHDNEDPEEEGW